MLNAALVERLYARATADRWGASKDAFAAMLTAAAERVAAGDRHDAAELERALGALHLEDLALACACAEGVDHAWDHFIRVHRPVLYRAAGAIDPTGGAREIADSLYGELFGTIVREGQRQSLFRYYHARSSLATWLRAVLAQRVVDRARQTRRHEPLPADEEPRAPTAAPSPSPSLLNYVALMQRVVAGVVGALPARDRLRLQCYYAQDLTLAQIGRALKEHEATVSRQLARTRRVVREQVERALRDEHRLSAAEIVECFTTVVNDPGPLDLADLIGSSAASAADSSAPSATDARNPRPIVHSKESYRGQRD